MGLHDNCFSFSANEPNGIKRVIFFEVGVFMTGDLKLGGMGRTEPEADRNYPAHLHMKGAFGYHSMAFLHRVPAAVLVLEGRSFSPIRRQRGFLDGVIEICRRKRWISSLPETITAMGSGCWPRRPAGAPAPCRGRSPVCAATAGASSAR